MRAVVLLAALAMVAACSPRGDEPRGEPIACAIGPAVKMIPDCRLEKIGKGAAREFVVHHRDGGFRRLALSPDGEGLVSADGADTVQSEVKADLIELAIGQDRYRIPTKTLESRDAP